jgi:polyketide biosynthesis enoyl-CoA hydratase PksH
MDLLSEPASRETLLVRFEDDICFIQIHRPGANNTIDDLLVRELADVLDRCESRVKIVVLEGSPEVFCFGADFKAIQRRVDAGQPGQIFDPGPMYDLWLRLAMGPYVTIAHVRGQANAGGIGFVAACDIVLADETASFGLSELLFGLIPACVLPFLVRRMGFAKANYMTLMTEPVSARCAHAWGLVDECAADSQTLLRRKLLRLRRLSRPGILRYKRYMNALDDSLSAYKAKALAANVEVFGDQDNLQKIARYVNTGRFPWEGD